MVLLAAPFLHVYFIYIYIYILHFLRCAEYIKYVLELVLKSKLLGPQSGLD